MPVSARFVPERCNLRKNGDNKNEAPRSREGLRANWRLQAACSGYADNGIDPWDADPKDGKVNATAAAFCARCPVRRECLIEGLQSDQLNGGAAFLIWGGLAPKQRRALVRARDRLSCPVCHGVLLVAAVPATFQACASCGITWKARKESGPTHTQSQ